MFIYFEQLCDYCDVKPVPRTVASQCHGKKTSLWKRKSFVTFCSLLLLFTVSWMEASPTDPVGAVFGATLPRQFPSAGAGLALVFMELVGAAHSGALTTAVYYFY